MLTRAVTICGTGREIPLAPFSVCVNEVGIGTRYPCYREVSSEERVHAVIAADAQLTRSDGGV